MNNVNENILKKGTIVEAIKLPVITIEIGPVKNLKDLSGVIWHDRGNVVIATKEAPDGCIYDQNRIAVVRIINSKVKMNGMFDIYAIDKNKAEKLLNKPFDLNSLSYEQIKELKPLLDVSSNICPSVTPAEYGRKVVVITEDMIGEQGYTYCHCSWEPEEVKTKMFKGDVFLIEDEKNCQGYRIGREEFEETHIFVNSNKYGINNIHNSYTSQKKELNNNPSDRQKYKNDMGLEM